MSKATIPIDAFKAKFGQLGNPELTELFVDLASRFL